LQYYLSDTVSRYQIKR